MCSWGTTVGTEPTLILEKLGGIMITRGTYNLVVSLDLKELIYYENLYQESVETFSSICGNMTEQIPKNACRDLYKSILATNNDITETSNTIQSFFSSRTKRSFWGTFGLMDSGDKTRIDYDLDKLRRNEEALRNLTDHQTSVVSAIYDFVNNSMISVDQKGLDIIDKIKNLQISLIEGINFTNHVREILKWETELLETGMWIQNFAEHIRRKQTIFMKIIMNEVTKSDLLLHIVSPNEIMKRLQKAKGVLPNGVKFPTGITEVSNEIYKLARLSHRFVTQRVLALDIEIPLVDEDPYEGFKVFITPQIRNFTVTLCHEENNIVIRNKINEYGYVVNEEILKQCNELQHGRLCSLKAPEENLTQSNKCSPQLIFGTSNTGCVFKTIRVNHTMWFVTTDENIWTYVSPESTEVNITNNGNSSITKIQGMGKIRLQEGMTIITNDIIIRHSRTILSKGDIEVKENFMNISEFTLGEWQTSQLPVINESEKIYSLLDNKRLFNLGIGVQDLKSERPMLHNLIYAPLENPWWSTGVLVGGAGIIFAIICGYKGKLTCCTRVATVKVSNATEQELPIKYLKDQEDIEMGVLNEAMNLEPEEILESKDIQLNNVKCIQEKKLNKTIDRGNKAPTTRTFRTHNQKGYMRRGVRVY